MSDDTNPHTPADWPTRAEDEARFRALSERLVEAVEAAVPAWVEGAVAQRSMQWMGRVPADVADAAARAGADAATEVGQRLRDLLAVDIDDQRANPLQVLRAAVAHPTRVLGDAGVPAVVRDDFAERSFPDDVYDLAPATWADIHPDLQEHGLSWSAAKAFVFKARRRAEGRR